MGKCCFLRPWALKEPYNTRDEVDAGLKHWSRKRSSFLKVYEQIQRQFPLAEQSLAKYYQNNFNLSPDDAKAKAALALDIAVRSHYTFPK